MIAARPSAINKPGGAELGAHRAAKQARPLTRLQQWALGVEARRGHNKATIAVANKLARIIWAVWTRDVPFGPTHLPLEAA